MSLQLCLTLCDPIDGSPPGSSVHGILQARTLEWVAISSSNAWKWKVKVKSLSRVRLLATPWTTAHQAPPSMGFSTQEYWSGMPLPSPSSNTAGPKISSQCSDSVFWKHSPVNMKILPFHPNVKLLIPWDAMKITKRDLDFVKKSGSSNF